MATDDALPNLHDAGQHDESPHDQTPVERRHDVPVRAVGAGARFPSRSERQFVRLRPRLIRLQSCAKKSLSRHQTNP